MDVELAAAGQVGLVGWLWRLGARHASLSCNMCRAESAGSAFNAMQT